jgi:D-serine deaminase-like pyridoxal phosphate-dependent protein
LAWDSFEIGSMVRVLPNHACATAAMYDRYYVTDGSTEISDVWHRVNGW